MVQVARGGGAASGGSPEAAGVLRGGGVDRADRGVRRQAEPRLGRRRQGHDRQRRTGRSVSRPRDKVQIGCTVHMIHTFVQPKVTIIVIDRKSEQFYYGGTKIWDRTSIEHLASLSIYPVCVVFSFLMHVVLSEFIRIQ